MSVGAVPEAWFVGFAARLSRLRAERPELPPIASGRTLSILALAIAEAANAEQRLPKTIRDRWLTMRTVKRALIPAFMFEALPPSHPLPLGAGPAPDVREPPTLGERVEIGRHRRSATEARSALKAATERIAALEDQIRDYEAVFRSDAKPADWLLAARREHGGGESEHIPELLTSDFQIGEVIRSEETDHAHGYDVATFRRRYRQLIETTIRLCFKHAGDGWRYPGIVYARGGDTISGGIHPELAETDELTPIEAVEVAFEEEAAGILRLADAFGRVQVEDAGGGNHDRDTLKPRSKRATGHSYDRMVSAWLRREFAGDDRVSFHGTLSPDVYFEIYDTRILLTHGDKIGSRGGMGMIGPAATISRGFQKVIIEQQSIGRVIDMVQCGHFHTPLWLEAGISNGCLPGYSEFAKMNRMKPHPPSQFLMFFAPRRGLVDLRKIVLD